MHEHNEKAYVLNHHRWVVLGLLASSYFLVYFHRVSTSVIATDLVADFHTNAAALGFMSSMYFYLYAFEQPIVGHFTDLLGARRVLAFWSFIAALGCSIFAMSPSIGWASVGRGLIGFGVGGVYVPAMKAFSQWFRREDFATMIGLLLAAGNLGAIAATTPLAWMASTWGWRMSFMIVGAVSVGLALMAIFFVHDPSPDTCSNYQKPALKNEGSTETYRVLVFRILFSLRFWILAAIFFGSFGPGITFQGLWATSFIMSALKTSRMHASWLNMILPVGYIIGAPIWGLLADRGFCNKVNFLLLLLGLLNITWIILSLAGHMMSAWGFAALFLLMGSTTGGLATTLWATVRHITPNTIIGLTTGLLNPFPLLGIAFMQGWTSAILNQTGHVQDIYSLKAFREVFLVCLLVVAISLVLCAFFRKQLGQAR